MSLIFSVNDVFFIIIEVILREREERKQNRLMEERDPARLVTEAVEMETSENPSDTSLPDNDQHLTSMKCHSFLCENHSRLLLELIRMLVLVFVWSCCFVACL